MSYSTFVFSFYFIHEVSRDSSASRHQLASRPIFFHQRAHEHARAVVAKLEDSDWDVRLAAVETLGQLEAAVLAEHAPAVVAMLEDSDWDIRLAAVETLGKLKAVTLAEHVPGGGKGLKRYSVCY